MLPRINLLAALLTTQHAPAMRRFLALTIGKKVKVRCAATGNVVLLRQYRGRSYFDRIIELNPYNTTKVL